jgi:predicted Rossmann-fold nucleotide-binding protein
VNEERIITVFGSSRPAETHPDYREARQVGHLLAEHGFAVCSGGYGCILRTCFRS